MKRGTEARRPYLGRWLPPLFVILVAGATLAPLSPAAAAAVALTLEVVPPMEGVRFTVDGQVHDSNRAGLVRVFVEEGEHVIRVVSSPRTESVRTRFSRWGDEVFRPRRRVEIRGPERLQVGFDVENVVHLTFRTPEGGLVPLSRVSDAQIKNSVNQFFDFPNEEGRWMRWLQRSRVIRRSIGLEAKPLQYSVERVTVDGSNVVNRAAQRVSDLACLNRDSYETSQRCPRVKVSSPLEWRLELLLYSARFAAQDLVFGRPVGSMLVLEYPDGTIRRLPLESEASVHVPGLARGTYRAWVEAPGISPPVPVRVSKPDQVAKLKVITYANLALFAAVLVGLAVGLVLAGRPRLRARVRSAIGR